CRTPSLGSDPTASPQRRHEPRGRKGVEVDREKALEMALGQIEKQFGKGSIMKLGERGDVGVEAIPTGALALDLALGIGGLPRGRIVEIFGPESSGKAALVPRAEIEGEMGDSHMGLQARLMSQALRKLTGNLNKSRTICIFINQLREKIGVLFGSPETTPGGRALKFYSSVRLDIRRIESIKDAAEVVGNRTRVKVVKNKVAPPFRQAEFDIMYGKGISREGSLLDVGVDLGLIKKSGAWFTYEGEQLGQGRENAKTFLGENAEIMMEISERILTQVGINRDGVPAEPADELADLDEPISLDD